MPMWRYDWGYHSRKQTLCYLRVIYQIHSLDHVEIRYFYIWLYRKRRITKVLSQQYAVYIFYLFVGQNN